MATNNPLYTYALNDIEKVKLGKWVAEHQTYCPRVKRYHDFSLAFSHEGGIGIGVTAICKTCGKKHDITDYETW